MNRYVKSSTIPQPIRKILPAITDYTEIFTRNSRLDKIAYKYYNDMSLSWIIMCANPDIENEFDILPGTEIRIPFPLSRVFNSWKIDEEI